MGDRDFYILKCFYKKSYMLINYGHILHWYKMNNFQHYNKWDFFIDDKQVSKSDDFLYTIYLKYEN